MIKTILFLFFQGKKNNNLPSLIVCRGDLNHSCHKERAPHGCASSEDVPYCCIKFKAIKNPFLQFHYHSIHEGSADIQEGF
jgi:hypothetical protein